MTIRTLEPVAFAESNCFNNLYPLLFSDTTNSIFSTNFSQFCSIIGCIITGKFFPSPSGLVDMKYYITDECHIIRTTSFGSSHVLLQFTSLDEERYAIKFTFNISLDLLIYKILYHKLA